MGHSWGGRAFAASLLLVAASGLAGCGDQGEGTATEPTSRAPSSSPADEPSAEKSEKREEVPPDTPGCSGIWHRGGEIPRFYQGCVDGAGNYVEREAVACSSGQRMVIYADRFYGVLGGTVHKAAARSLDDDRRYRHEIRACRA